MPGPLQNSCKQLIWILRPVKGEEKNSIKKVIIKRKYFVAHKQDWSVITLGKKMGTKLSFPLSPHHKGNTQMLMQTARHYSAPRGPRF